VFNDLRNPQKAVPDFQAAIQLQPEYGEAHLAWPILISSSTPADGHGATGYFRKIAGAVTHFGIWAGQKVFGKNNKFAKAELEYRVALERRSPRTFPTQLALPTHSIACIATTKQIELFNVAVNLSPDNPFIYSQMAQAYAKLRRREDTFRYIQAAGANLAEKKRMS